MKCKAVACVFNDYVKCKTYVCNIDRIKLHKGL